MPSTLTTGLAGRSFHIVTLGCSKNRVDSDGMTTLLQQRGMEAVTDPALSDAVIVNTCGFLGAAREESIAAIEQVLAERHDGQVVIAAGCMPALGNYSASIPAGVDHILTTREWTRIGNVVGSLFGLAEEPQVAGCEGMLTTFTHAQAGPSAYVKIADGCDHACAFCTIPAIKGRQVSKPPLHVLQEIVDLVSRGTKEIVLVAQDTIRYGADIGIKKGLPSLLESIAQQVSDLAWLRMLYIYPSPLTLAMVDTMAAYPSLLNYLDMPLQHADAEVLKRMNRPSDPQMTRRLLDHARNTLPDLAMRTTFIVGYPGETEAQFLNLLRFVETEQFDHVGVFTYSPEPGTPAALLRERVPPAVAEERRGMIMETQQAISYRKNRALVGSEIEILVEAVGESEDESGNLEPISAGRTWRHAPEVDGLVLARGALPVGEFARVVVFEATPYDLFARQAGAKATATVVTKRPGSQANTAKTRLRKTGIAANRKTITLVPAARQIEISPID